MSTPPSFWALIILHLQSTFLFKSNLHWQQWEVQIAQLHGMIPGLFARVLDLVLCTFFGISLVKAYIFTANNSSGNPFWSWCNRKMNNNSIYFKQIKYFSSALLYKMINIQFNLFLCIWQRFCHYNLVLYPPKHFLWCILTYSA